MANEAVCIETPTIFRRYTIATGTAIPYGTLLKLTDPNTAIATSADNDPFAGICWVSKTATDGKVEVTAAMNGVWDITCTAAAITVGALVSIGGANLVLTADAAAVLAGQVVGKAMETSSTTEVIRIVVGASV
jgi:hypothetical protein